MTLQEKIKQLAAQYPGVATIHVKYTGEGDSFDDFYDIEFRDEDENPAYNPCLNKVDLQQIAEFALDQTHISFDNEGSEGAVIINLQDGTVGVDNYYKVRETVWDGNYAIDITDTDWED